MKVSTDFGEITIAVSKGAIPQTDFVARATGDNWGGTKWVIVKGPEQFIELLGSDKEHYPSSGTIDFSQIWEKQKAKLTAVLSPN